MVPLFGEELVGLGREGDYQFKGRTKSSDEKASMEKRAE